VFSSRLARNIQSIPEPAICVIVSSNLKLHQLSLIKHVAGWLVWHI
jgi:hypothetical protein